MLTAAGAWFAATLWNAATDAGWGVPLDVVLYGSLPVAVVWRLVREATHHAPRPVRRVVGPGVQGLGEVQDIYLGRPDVGPPTYAKPEGVVAEVVVDRRDPLDDVVRVVAPPRVPR